MMSMSPCPSCHTIPGFPTKFCPVCGTALATPAPPAPATPPPRFAAAHLPPVPRPITHALDVYFLRDFEPPSEAIWLAVGFPFIVFEMLDDMFTLFRPKRGDEANLTLGKIVCVVTLLTVPVLAGANVLPRVPTLVIEAVYLAITFAIGIWLAGKEERIQTATLAARRRTFEQGRAVDVTIDSVHQLDIGGVRVRGKLGDRTIAIDVPPELASRVAEGGVIEVLEPAQPADDDRVYATALLE